MFTGLYARLIGLGLVAAAVVSGYLYIHSLRSENERLKTENTVIGAKLTEQNSAIDTMKKDADARLAVAQADIDAAKAATVKAQAAATVIYKAKPSTPGNDCKSALDLINRKAAPSPAASAPARKLIGE